MQGALKDTDLAPLLFSSIKLRIVRSKSEFSTPFLPTLAVFLILRNRSDWYCITQYHYLFIIKIIIIIVIVIKAIAMTIAIAIVVIKVLVIIVTIIIVATMEIKI